MRKIIGFQPLSVSAVLGVLVALGAALRGWKIMDMAFACPDHADYTMYANYYLNVLSGVTDISRPFDVYTKPANNALAMLVIYIFGGGGSEAPLYFVNVVFGSLSVIAVYAIAKAMTKSAEAGLLAGAFSATMPQIILIDRMGVAHAANGFFFLLSLYCLIKYFEDKSNWNLRASGVLLGVAMLFHPSTLIYLPLFSLIAAIHVYIYGPAGWPDKLKNLFWYGIFMMIPLIAAEIEYKAIFAMAPKLNNSTHISYWLSGYFYDLFRHFLAVAPSEGGSNLSFFIRFVSSSVAYAPLSIIYTALFLTALAWLLFRVERRRDFASFAVMTVIVIPLAYWSVQRGSAVEPRYVYPVFLFLAPVFASSLFSPLFSGQSGEITKRGMVALYAALLFIVGLNTYSYALARPAGPTVYSVGRDVIRDLSRNGHRDAYIYAGYKTFAWDMYMQRYYGYDAVTFSYNFWSNPNGRYFADMPGLIKALKDGRIETLIFVNVPYLKDSESSVGFRKFVEKHHLDSVVIPHNPKFDTPEYTYGSWDPDYIIAYDIAKARSDGLLENITDWVELSSVSPEMDSLWRINAAGTKGNLRFTKKGDVWTGGVKWDVNSYWEPLKDVLFDERKNTISFARTSVRQVYSATLSQDGKTCRGYYKDESSGNNISWDCQKAD